MKYNCVPIGDHCVVAENLKALGLRTASYPFDWVSYHSPNIIQITNINYNIGLIQELMDTSDVHTIVKSYIGDALENKEHYNTSTNILFPHESGTRNEIFEKYERRFQRLKTDIQTQPNLFMLISRCYLFERTTLDSYVKLFQSYHPDNKLLFICGVDHPYLHENPYGTSVIFKYIPYDHTKFYQYDYTDFRPNVTRFLQSYDFTI